MSTAHNIPNLNTFVCTHPVWTKAICSIQSTNTFIKIKISSKNWYLQAGNYCCGWFGRVRSFFNTLEFISIFWDQKNVCSLNLTWCFVQMPCALAHRLVEQPKKYCCVRFKICWPGHLLTQNMQDQFSFHKNVWSFDLILSSARQFISYLLFPSLSVSSETFVDLSCLARHWKKTQNRYYNS